MPHQVDVPADRILEAAERIADHLLDVQRRVNAQVDATQSELLPAVRRLLGQADEDAVDLTGLVNARIAGLSIVVTPEAVATVLPLGAASAATTRAGRRAMTDILGGADRRLAVIAGPCSIHDPAATLEYVDFLRGMRERHGADLEIVMRTYTEKPRTEVDWKGFAYDPYLDGSNRISVGLIATRMLMRRITAMGVPVAAEPLNALTPRDREILLLWDAGLSYPEIAAQTGLAVGAVGTTLARARRRLVEAHDRQNANARDHAAHS